ncbi:MAG: hypothetical protein NC043_05340 [Muribaculaceae bacterium]|nr:hypothetical protein [Muribaculaceae bacterium]
MTQRHSRGFIPWCRRYISFSLVATVGILTYLLFFTDNSVAASYVQERKNDSLRVEIAMEEDSLAFYTRLNHQLSTDPGTMEQIVRERYHMQRPGEDVYIVEP